MITQQHFVSVQLSSLETQRQLLRTTLYFQVMQYFWVKFMEGAEMFMELV